jgi:hypothetical protein
VSALEVIAAVLLVLGSALVFRALLEADRLFEASTPSRVSEPEVEELAPLRQAA